LKTKKHILSLLSITLTCVFALIVTKGHAMQPSKQDATIKENQSAKVQISTYAIIDGSLQKMSPTPGKGMFVTPCIDPQGYKAVFHGGSSGYSRIFEYDYKKSKTTPITSDDFVSIFPTYSQDGKLIVFSADRGVDQTRTDMALIGKTLPWRSVYLGGKLQVMNLYVMNSDGSNLHQITSGDFVDIRGCFSPDGKTIVFCSNRDGWWKNSEPKLYSVPVDGSKEPKLLQTTGGGARPWFSMDGKMIFFHSKVNGRDTLCKMPSNGGDVIPLPDDTLGVGSHGSFADPDGIHLWFHNKYNGLNQIFKLPIKGGHPEQFIIPGFEKEHVGHLTRARNGNMTFDVTRGYK